MNLNIYDEVEEKIDKTKTWINVNRKELLSREIVFKQYYLLAKQFSPKTKTYLWFLILVDDKPENEEIAKRFKRTHKDNFGRIKIKVANIWDKTSLTTLKQDANINIKIDEQDDIGEIYQLDV